MGIGTNTPNANVVLDVRGSANYAISALTTGSVATLASQNGGSGPAIAATAYANGYGVQVESYGSGSAGYFTNHSTGPALVTSSGNVGIGTLTPASQLDVQSTVAANNYIVNVKNAGAGSGVYSNIENASASTLTSQTAIRGESSTQIGVAGLSGSGYGVAGFASTGAGAYGTATSGKAVYGYATGSGIGGYFYSTSGYGLIVANGNVGIGTTAPTYQLDVVASGTQNAIHGSSTSYGVTGECTATSPGSLFPYAGVTGIGNANSNCFYGINTYNNTKTAEFVNSGTAGIAVRAASSSTTGAAIQIEGNIKVAGSNKAAFNHTVSAANTITNATYTTLSYAGATSTDILFVTHTYNGNLYHNHSVGAWWTGSAWAIYNEDNATPMVLGDTFNILVIKQ